MNFCLYVCMHGIYLLRKLWTMQIPAVLKMSGAFCMDVQEMSLATSTARDSTEAIAEKMVN